MRQVNNITIKSNTVTCTQYWKSLPVNRIRKATTTGSHSLQSLRKPWKQPLQWWKFHQKALLVPHSHTKGKFYILCKVGGQVSHDVTHQLQEQSHALVSIAFSVLLTTPVRTRFGCLHLQILKLLIRTELNGKIFTALLRLGFWPKWVGSLWKWRPFLGGCSEARWQAEWGSVTVHCQRSFSRAGR